EVSWPTPLTPRSREYDDIFWSRDQGVAEKTHVFVHGNRLDERWATLQHGSFTLAEIGFGFGINFLVTANLWRQRMPRGAVLNYIAFEKSPVSPADLRRLYASLDPEPGIDPRDRDQLLAHYPLPSPGMHLRWLDTNVCLTLVVGDANAILPSLNASVDAWYLDGFSPSHNKDAWRPALFEAMATRCAPGATATTYSVAGAVRRGLADAGFELSRAPGFGAKSEMLVATRPGNWRAANRPEQHIAIIGAGIAGLHCARALSRRGIEARVFDAGAPLTGASVIPRLAISPRLAVRPDTASLFSLAAFQYAMAGGSGITAGGQYRFATTARDWQRHARIAAGFPDEFCELLDAATVQSRIGISADAPGLWFATAGWCDPQDHFADLLPACAAGHSVNAIETGEHGVRLTLSRGEALEFDQVIVATGHQAFPGLGPLGLVPVRGQALEVRLPATLPDTLVTGPLSLVPAGDGRVIVGATFDLDDADCSIRAKDTEILLRRMKQFTGHSTQAIREFVGIRATTRDRMPVAGALPDWTALAEYHRQGRRNPFTDYNAQIHVLTGFGSHGATHAPLAAEHVARRVCKESDGITEGWRKLLDPMRLGIRNLD
ncbi:MAG TPA: FAD-dependent 5-carboxymethylaminomethyl-2-thiouridine(34) oxidoreductase MnmC, partial [Pseudomonadales bacterium]|nr:FAD-dependent 5-carboxymethylaminomethyl-2-thiouridine(34) oxidoreductase MnmC [Pseudomonadales bacterium]